MQVKAFQKLASDYFATGTVLADLFNHFAVDQKNPINPYRLSSLDPTELIVYDDQTAAVGPADFTDDISSVLVSDGKKAYLILSTDQADELEQLESLHVLGYGYSDYMDSRKKTNPYRPVSAEASIQPLPVSEVVVYLGEDVPDAAELRENLTEGAGNVVGGQENRRLVIPSRIPDDEIHAFSSSLRELFEGLNLAADPEKIEVSMKVNSDFLFLPEDAAALLGYCTGLSF